MRARGWIAVGVSLVVAALVARTVANSWAEAARVAPGTLEVRVLARAMVVAVDGVAEVRPQVGGRVLAVHVREGDRVAAGQVLAEVESEDIKAELARREAERTAMSSAARAVAEGMRPEERTQIEAELRAARHDLELAQDRLDRQLKLEASGSSTDSVSKEARHAVEVAQARVQAADARLRLARSGGRPAEVSAARAHAAAADAAVAEARVQLGRAKIEAPLGGVVLARRVDPGDTMVSAALGPPTPIFEIADDTRVEVRAEVEEEDAAGLQVGLPVTLTTRGGKAVVARGKLSRLGARLERRTIGVDDARVRADAQVRTAWIEWGPGARPPVAIGQQLEAVIELAPRPVQAMVPREAVLVRAGRAVVESPSGPFQREIPVVLGLADDRNVEVRGVDLGTKVLTRR
jgi:multidrug resistance efflux pump